MKSHTPPLLTLLQRQTYLATILTRVLDHLHTAAELRLEDNDAPIELAEWLAEFDLYETEYRDMMRLREALLLKSVAIAFCLAHPAEHAEDGSSNGAVDQLTDTERATIRNTLYRMQAWGFCVTGARDTQWVHDTPFAADTQPVTEDELNKLDICLEEDFVRDVIENVLEVSEEHEIPLPFPPSLELEVSDDEMNIVAEEADIHAIIYDQFLSGDIWGSSS
jgi:hypothetical protein